MDLTPGQPFNLGINYWPRRKAMFWWRDFDPAEVDDDFALIASLGLKTVRLFLLWDDFQKSPDTVEEGCVAHLGAVCDLAAKHDLVLDVTFFTGHMSGPNWAPGWLLGGKSPARRNGARKQVVSGGQVTRLGYRNPYHDPAALAAEKLLIQTIVGRYHDHPAIWLWNLGNEPDLFDWPHSAAAGRDWVSAMTGLIHSLDASHRVTIGLHVGSLLEDNHLRIDQVYGQTDLAVMHAYSMYMAPLSRRPLDPDVVPFTCALTASLAGKPVLMEEFGGCTAPPGQRSQTWRWRAYGHPRSQFMASEEDYAEYLRATLPRLVEVGAQGALVWCFADYAEELWHRPPCDQSRHERFFGLVRPDGSLKPHAQVLKEFAASKPMIHAIPDYAHLPITPARFYGRLLAPMLRLPGLYRRYLSQKSR